jgi:serine/threonine protein kinase
VGVAERGRARNGVAKIGVLRQTLCGLEHVHRMGVVHGDVKPDNVFVDHDGVAKLGDFDVSHQQDSATRTMTRIGVTDAYCAPELEPKLWAQRAPQPSKASDVFALGLTMFDIMCSQQTLQRPVALDMLREHELVEGGDNQLRSLVGALTAPEPSKRPTASAALLLGAFAPPSPGRRSCARSTLVRGVL